MSTIAAAAAALSWPAAASAATISSLVAFAALGLGAAAWSGHRALRHESARRQAADAEVRRLALELERTRRQLHSLRELLAVCSWCRNVRDRNGEWRSLESYLETHFEAAFSHGVCPECLSVQYPNLFEKL